MSSFIFHFRWQMLWTKVTSPCLRMRIDNAVRFLKLRPLGPKAIGYS